MTREKKRMRHRLFEISDWPKPFRMIAADPHDVMMTWLTEKEDGRTVRLPRLILWVTDLNARGRDNKGIVALITHVLRKRDRERGRCGLPPYWEKIARKLDQEALTVKPPSREGE